MTQGGCPLSASVCVCARGSVHTRIDVSVQSLKKKKEKALYLCLDVCFLCVRASTEQRMLEKGESRVCVNGCAYSICV